MSCWLKEHLYAAKHQRSDKNLHFLQCAAKLTVTVLALTHRKTAQFSSDTSYSNKQYHLLSQHRTAKPAAWSPLKTNSVCVCMCVLGVKRFSNFFGHPSRKILVINNIQLWKLTCVELKTVKELNQLTTHKHLQHAFDHEWVLFNTSIVAPKQQWV